MKFLFATRSRVALKAAFLLAGACSSSSTRSTQVEPCAPGESVSCETASGCSGKKLCKASGDGFGECLCLDGGGSDAVAGAAGTSGAAGSSGSDGSAATSGCPSGLAGPALIMVTAPTGEKYCVDTTEVTNADYARFLATNPATSGQLAECSWNTTYVPSNGWPATGQESNPVASVDWCDAYAYCKAVGKRLCGKIAGGPNAFNDYAQALLSQWDNACSGGGTKSYSYGNTYSATACNGYENGAGATLPVASKTSCEGGYPSLFDLNGNVWEWEDSCEGTTGAPDQCRLRGGSFFSAAALLACAADNAVNRDYQNGDVGFRCCVG